MNSFYEVTTEQDAEKVFQALDDERATEGWPQRDPLLIRLAADGQVLMVGPIFDSMVSSYQVLSYLKSKGYGTPSLLDLVLNGRYAFEPEEFLKMADNVSQPAKKEGDSRERQGYL